MHIKLTNKISCVEKRLNYEEAKKEGRAMLTLLVNLGEDEGGRRYPRSTAEKTVQPQARGKNSAKSTNSKIQRKKQILRTRHSQITKQQD